MSKRWVLLVYRVPREPSTPRIAVWRKLRRLGVAQLADGLVALPLDARNRERLEWVAVPHSNGAAETAALPSGPNHITATGEPPLPRTPRRLLHYAA